ncbi:hypothetical protein RN001_008994 [Aquatica leii]|uniref:Uncharacterized protein n=1 Tax=Aquatica leii TaxID=1421715 RepID=A0AAN7QJD2_9COLE|nr:hypothetical protein RN001_008994 [Aquatica leii]
MAFSNDNNQNVSRLNYSDFLPQSTGICSQTQSLHTNAPVNSETAFQKQVFKLLHSLNYKIDNLQADINILLNRNTTKETITDEIIVNIIRCMPFDTKEDVENFETLTDIQLKILAQELSLIGGDSVN